MEWRSLSSEGDLKQILRDSDSKVQAIFKHSTRCGISSMAKKRLELQWELKNTGVPIYMLNIIEHRSLSNLIADSLAVQHESPQLILLHQGEAFHDSSHASISSSNAAKHIENRLLA